jgi:hypothetical protein
MTSAQIAGASPAATSSARVARRHGAQGRCPSCLLVAGASAPLIPGRGSRRAPDAARGRNTRSSERPRPGTDEADLGAVAAGDPSVSVSGRALARREARASRRSAQGRAQATNLCWPSTWNQMLCAALEWLMKRLFRRRRRASDQCRARTRTQSCAGERSVARGSTRRSTTGAVGSRGRPPRSSRLVGALEDLVGKHERRGYDRDDDDGQSQPLGARASGAAARHKSGAPREYVKMRRPSGTRSGRAFLATSVAVARQDRG